MNFGAGESIAKPQRSAKRRTMNHQRRNVPACNTSSRPRGCSLPAVAGSGRGSPPYYCCCAGSS